MLEKYHEINYLGVVKFWQAVNRNIVYGDIEDPELLERIPFEDSKVKISTVADRDHSLHLMKTLERTVFKGKIYLTAIHEKDFLILSSYGADKVLLPHQMAAINFYNYYLSDLIPERNINSSE